MTSVDHTPSVTPSVAKKLPSSDSDVQKNGFLNIFRAPRFGDPAKDRIAGLQHKILMGLFFTMFLGIGISLLFWNSTSLRGLSILIFEMLLLMLAFYWQRHGHLERSSWILVSTMYLVFILACALTGYTFPIALILALSISLAGLLLPYYSVIAVTVFSVVTIWVLPYVIVSMPVHIKLNEIGYASIIIALEGTLLTVASRTLAQSFADTDQSKQSLILSNKDLQEMATNLEQRVEERTKALSRQTIQLQKATEVSRAISSTLDINELLQQSVDLIHNRFDMHYVGLFLLDEPRRMAVLKASTGETGVKMLAGNHQLEINDNTLVGWSISHKQAQIGLRASKEAARLDNNSLLPSAHSELALPLISQKQVIGAMTLQSERESAFSPEDVNILQTIADQLANGIEKARLYEQIQQRAIELDKAREIADSAKNDAEKARISAEEANSSLAMQMWQTTGQTLLNEKMRGEQDLTTLANNVIQHLCQYLKIENGAIYTLEDKILYLTGTYAYRRKSLEQQYQMGEDLVGQGALEREIITYQIPEEYIAISLRQGKLLPRFRLVAPVVYNQHVSGVLTLESMTEFTVAQKRFLEEATESVAIAFMTAQARARVNELFAETRQQAEELQAQEEELRATNEELQAQSESLRTLKA